jgi:aryl-alcohol dehydrogenase-like predicted oxidoreductase
MQVYSSGLSEEILGRAIKQHNLPRDEIVIMTKAFFPVSRDQAQLIFPGPAADADGYVNQYGLSRKVFHSSPFSRFQLTVRKAHL